jgi:peptidoglycan/xylan/chitin deacetylase (PgdA/CDA1 family)
MIGRVTVKRAIKRTAGVASTFLRPLVARHDGPRVCILVYHRVARVGFRDPHLDNWNVEPELFERQIAALARHCDIVGLADVCPMLEAGGRTGADRPAVCLTFDDGFANFHSEVLPVLRRYHVKAALFVVTAYVGSTAPMAFDRWSCRHAHRVPRGVWRPIDWNELEECVASGLVTVGSHSHEHRIGTACTPGDLRAEAQRSREILLSRLGEAHACCYSYPYGSSRPLLVPPAYVTAVQEAGYSLAVSTDMGLAGRDSRPHWLPRIEAFELDSPAVLRAKAAGVLTPFLLSQWLRTAKRSA